ncbi:MAG: hypothetical protein ABEJ05_12845 [Haloglomus sp.]
MTQSEVARTLAQNETPDALLWTGGRNRCHIPDAGREVPRCGIEADLQLKPVEMVPPAHREWCRRCLACWRAADAPTDR